MKLTHEIEDPIALPGEVIEYTVTPLNIEAYTLVVRVERIDIDAHFGSNFRKDGTYANAFRMEDYNYLVTVVKQMVEHPWIAEGTMLVETHDGLKKQGAKKI